MLRLVFVMMCGAVLALATFSTDASAQRPAAWDTRVVRSPVAAPPDPQADKTVQEPQEQKDKTKKALDAAGSPKHNRAKVN